MEKRKTGMEGRFSGRSTHGSNELPKLKPLQSFLEPLTAQFNYYIWNIH